MLQLSFTQSALSWCEYSSTYIPSKLPGTFQSFLWVELCTELVTFFPWKITWAVLITLLSQHDVSYVCNPSSAAVTTDLGGLAAHLLLSGNAWCFLFPAHCTQHTVLFLPFCTSIIFAYAASVGLLHEIHSTFYKEKLNLCLTSV